ncbi:MAG: hypothetical protein WKF78_07975 [Candidatus Limnocylindrales bacterium]
MSGRSTADVSSRPEVRPVSAPTTPACVRGARATPAKPADLGEPRIDSGAVCLFDFARGAHDAREQEEGEAQGEEDVAQGRDVANEGEGDRDQVTKDQTPGQEVERLRIAEDEMKGRGDVGRRQARGAQGRQPDRHAPTVEDDDDGIEHDAD